MKNLIVNVFKTLFFFDLGLILISIIPAISFKKEELLIFSSNLTNFLIVGGLTFFFWLFVEKRKLKSYERSSKIKATSLGLLSGLLIPLIYALALIILKFMKFEGFNKPEKIWYYILALFLKVLWTELLLRGYLFSLYKKHYGFIFATIFTTLLFISMNHEILKMNKTYMWTMVLFNVYLCFLRDKFKSVFATIFANFGFSFANIMLLGCKVSDIDYPKLLNLKLDGKEKIIGSEFLIMGSRVTLIAFCVILLVWFTVKYKLWQYFTKAKIKSYVGAIKQFFIGTVYNVKSIKYIICRYFEKSMRIIRRHR